MTALAIFLFSLIGIGQLLSHSADRALDAQQVGQATLLGQAKMAEVLCGAAPLTSQGDTACEEDPDYQWSLDCQTASVTGLWNVQVIISRNRPEGKRVLCTLSQMVLDPAQRGSAADTPAGSQGSSGNVPAPAGATGSLP